MFFPLLMNNTTCSNNSHGCPQTIAKQSQRCEGLKENETLANRDSKTLAAAAPVTTLRNCTPNFSTSLALLLRRKILWRLYLAPELLRLHEQHGTALRHERTAHTVTATSLQVKKSPSLLHHASHTAASLSLAYGTHLLPRALHHKAPNSHSSFCRHSQ
jgi:hypothetical protein